MMLKTICKMQQLSSIKSHRIDWSCLAWLIAPNSPTWAAAPPCPPSPRQPQIESIQSMKLIKIMNRPCSCSNGNSGTKKKTLFRLPWELQWLANSYWPRICAKVWVRWIMQVRVAKEMPTKRQSCRIKDTRWAKNALEVKSRWRK